MNTSNQRILCIEDDPEMIDLIRIILSQKGYEATGAAGGEDGLQKNP